ncbi:PP2C family protein-serine/threonine phosphatase [Streptomyces sp. NPDC048361]|uniref:PP2C family protein-serine/threonine phosphatase n=1 Tax=Streptomyces sp. NPDC048361 TaxID=3154720 RepID=UPI00341E6BD6
MTLALFGAIAKLLPHPVLLCGADGRILAANPAAARCDSRLVPGALLFDVESADAPLLRTHLAAWLRSGTPVPGALAIKDADGRLRRFRCHGARAQWWDGPIPAAQLHMNPLEGADQFVVLSQQVAALNREVAFRRSLETERARLLAAEQAARARLQHLYALTAALAAAVTVTQVCRAVQDTAPAALGAAEVRLLLHSTLVVPPLEPGDRPRAAAGWTDLDLPASIASPASPASPGSTAVTASTAGAEPLELSLPLEADGVRLGRLAIHGAGQGTAPEHATAVAQQIAQALRRAGLHEHEHQVSEHLQMSLLPHLPSIAGLETATCYAPGSDLLSVGGDWYDVYDIDAEHIGLTIGDVAGHGLREASVMAQIIAALRSIVPNCGALPVRVLDELNAFLGRYHPDGMATACYLIFHRPTRVLTYAAAGHPPPLLIHADGTSTYLDQAVNPPLGPIRGFAYRQATHTLAEDDTLLLYTDGLIERRREVITDGLERLTASARTAVGLDLADLCDRFLNHQPDAVFPDDRALLAARFPHT